VKSRVVSALLFASLAAAFLCIVPDLAFAYSVTWATTTAPQAYWSSIASSADGTKLAATSASDPFDTFANDGSIYISTDGGATWAKLDASGKAGGQRSQRNH